MQQTSFAYLADVEHEVKPVTKGRRVSLLYNLHRRLAPVPSPLKLVHHLLLPSEEG